MLDIQAELHDAGGPYQDLYEAVADLKRRHDLHPCAVRPRDSLSLRNDDEREQVQELVARFRRLPEETRRRLPALWNSLGQLQVVIGDLDASQRDFEAVARLVTDPISRAEAHHNAHHAALERGDRDTALTALRRAVALDPETFEPFPFERYDPRQILAASGFGVSFLCTDRASRQEVVVRTLRLDALDRDATALLQDAHALRELDHPALVGILDAGRAGPENDRPYLVLEPFDGEPLDRLIARCGPLSPEECLEIAWPMARALQALHGRGLLHRSLRPAAVLLRRVKNRDGVERWLVKLADAGPGLRRSVLHASASYREASRHSTLGRTVAELLPYLPPEVVGRPKGQVWVGPHSDLFALGRLCAFVLTGRPDADAADRLLLPEAWGRLIDECTAWTINRRLAQAGAALERLGQTPGAQARVHGIERDLHDAAVAALTAALEAEPDRVAAYVQRAAAYLRQGEFERAVADCTEAIARRAGDASLYRQRARAHSLNADLDAAIADYSEALRLEPRHLESLGSRGAAHAQRGDLDAAIADFTEAIRLAPRDEGLYLSRGNAYQADGDLVRAIGDFTEAIRLDPRQLRALGSRGKAYLLHGEPARAIIDFNRLLELDPGNLRALCDRAVAYLDLGASDRAVADYSAAIRLAPTAALYHARARAHGSAGNLEAAIADGTEALALSPENAALLIARARALLDAGRAEEARIDLSRALEIAPESTEALLLRASVHARGGAFAPALADCDEAVRLDPDSAAALFHRGGLHAESGDQDRAIADFTEVLRLDPRAAAALTNRGNAHARLGNLEQAIADYSASLALLPDDPLTLLNRAGARARLNDLDAALADYTEVLRLDPAHARAHVSRGLLLAGQGEVERAMDDFDRAVALDPGNARAYNHRGNLYADCGQPERALADFSEAIRLDPVYALAWYNRAIARAEEGDYAAAVADLGEVLRLEANNVGALVNRGAFRRRLGDAAGALVDFSAAIALDPELVPAYFNRAAVHGERGALDAALADLDRLLELQPDDVAAYLNRGRLHGRRGDHARALADNLAAHQRAPDDPRVANNLAWHFATVPLIELRDPPRAVELARQACAAGEDANRLDTLAAALAACGQFEEAAEQQRRALEQADGADRAAFLTRLALYEARQSYVQPDAGTSDDLSNPPV